MAQIVSLEQMQLTVRRMTARYTEQALTTSQLNNYINLAYTILLPLQFRNIKLNKPYVFYTQPNVDTYDFIYENDPTDPVQGGQTTASPGNIEILPPVYCQGYALHYCQDKSNFYNRWPKLSVNQIIGTGTGLTQSYIGIIPNVPFLRAQLDIFGNVTEPAVIISASDTTGGVNSGYSYILTDKPQPSSDVGYLFDAQNNNVGDVNYITGHYTFTPANSATIPKTATIYASVVPYMASRPIDVLFYNQQIVLRPVPALVFQVEFQISQQPTQLIALNAAPELDEWYLYCCALAAKLIYTDFPDPDGMAYLQQTLDEQVLMAQRRTLRQMSTQRAQTIFSQLGRRNGAGYFYGSEYAGN